jgi:hypothetical protein
MSVRPRIKICHILLDPDQPQDIALEKWDSVMGKQNASIAAFEKIASNFACYSQMYSVVNRTDLPSDNCAQPEIINPSKEFINIHQSFHMDTMGLMLHIELLSKTSETMML